MYIPDHYTTHNYFVFDGKSSLDFGVGISGNGTFRKSHRRVERFTIPGRNGTLTISDGTFEDVDIVYPAYFVDGFSVRFDALAEWLYSKQGMKRLEDTYHPEHFRLGEFVGDIDPDMGTLNRSGRFDLTFKCDGRKFLKSGERVYSFPFEDQVELYEGTYSVRFINPTLFYAKPLIGLAEPGTIIFNGKVFAEIKVGATITRDENKHFGIGMDSGYAVIDCDSGESYDYLTGTSNNEYTVVNGDFPVLAPGENWIAARNNAYEQIDFAIIPRWYVL